MIDNSYLQQFEADSPELEAGEYGVDPSYDDGQEGLGPDDGADTAGAEGYDDDEELLREAIEQIDAAEAREAKARAREVEALRKLEVLQEELSEERRARLATVSERDDARRRAVQAEEALSTLESSTDFAAGTSATESAKLAGLRDEVTTLKAERDAARAARDRADKEGARVKARAAEVDKLLETVNQLVAERDELLGEVNELSDVIEQAMDERDAALETQKSHAAEIEALQSSHVASAEFDGVKAELATAVAALAAKSDALETKQDEIRSSGLEIKQLKESLAVIERSRDALSRERDEALVAHEGLIEARDAAITARDARIADHDAAVAEHERVRSEYQQVLAARDELADELAAVRKTTDELQRKYETALRARDSMAKEHEAALRAQDALKAARDAAEQALADGEASVRAALEERDAARRAAAEAEARVQSANSERQRLSAELEEEIAARAELEAQLSAAVNERNRLHGSAGQLEGERAGFEATLAKAVQQSAAAERRVRELENALARETAARERAERSVADFNTQSPDVDASERELLAQEHRKAMAAMDAKYEAEMDLMHEKLAQSQASNRRSDARASKAERALAELSARSGGSDGVVGHGDEAELERLHRDGEEARQRARELEEELEAMAAEMAALKTQLATSQSNRPADQAAHQKGVNGHDKKAVRNRFADSTDKPLICSVNLAPVARRPAPEDESPASDAARDSEMPEGLLDDDNTPDGKIFKGRLATGPDLTEELNGHHGDGEAGIVPSETAVYRAPQLAQDELSGGGNALRQRMERSVAAKELARDMRRAKRLNSRKVASIYSEALGTRLSCTVLDRSSSGAKLEIVQDRISDRSKDISIGDSFTLTMNYATEQTSIDCEVVWLSDRRCGVRFCGQIRTQSINRPERRYKRKDEDKPAGGKTFASLFGGSGR